MNRSHFASGNELVGLVLACAEQAVSETAANNAASKMEA
jgi:hypothetical protein